MKYNPELHDRHSIRLRGYDYANTGAYFVTVCLNRRIPKKMHIAQGQQYDFPTFGVVENGVMILNDSGKMVEKYILEIVNNTDKFFNVKINEYVVMPDHIHAIIKINDPSITNPPVGADLRVCPCAVRVCPCATCGYQFTPIELGTIIQWLKTMTTNEYTNGVKTSHWKPFHKKLWQRNYYERIIRDEAEYARIVEYIHNNPILWEKA